MAQSKPKKILVIGPSWVGDMVMAQSLFIALKQDNPTVQIDVLAMDWTRPLLDRMPEVTQALSMPITHGVFAWKQRKALGHQLRSEKYDQAIVLPNSWKSALIPWFANIPVRTGWRGEMRYGLLNDIRVLNKTNLPLMVQRYVSLAYAAKESKWAPSYPSPKMVANISTFSGLPSLELNQKRLVLCPGAEFGPAKQWPTSHYAEVASVMLQRAWQVVILGSKADKPTGQKISEKIEPSVQSQCFDFTGLTSLEEAIDILATADQVISNDSGLMHIASALQRPLIAVYGPTSPNFTPPLSPNAVVTQIDVDCGPCFQRTCPEGHHECMRNISSNNILSKIKD